MSKVYSCSSCKTVFTHKIELTRHSNKKHPCIVTMNPLEQPKDTNIANKTTLSIIFNYCLDVLRNNEHLTGDKALRTLAHLLDLRLLEHQFDQSIDIDGYEYDFSAYDDSIVESHKSKLLKLVRFSNLVKENEENIPTIMKCLWSEILSVHPITKNIFLPGKGFDIQHQSTYKKLIDKLYTFDFESVDEDILGEAYEEVIKNVMIGKTLGQFFTPPKVKQMMVSLIDPKVNSSGTIETIFDPAMGTGGFLITCLRHLLKKSKSQNIPLDWDFIRKQGLGGREAEPDTYQLAVSNMLIASGKMFKCLEKGDSIRDPITNKYDIILANPPFGIKLPYSDITSTLRNEYIPIKTDSAVILFLQAIIHMLKVNGRCAMILPEGKELFSKGKEFVAVREYLMKTCDLKEVIYLPAGTFTNTTIKTCVFYFHKKKEVVDVLETKLTYSKMTKKEISRKYKFVEQHQTHNVKFYNYNPENDTKNLLLELSVEDISENNYSLNYAEYLTETDNEVDGVLVKTLGEVCNFDIGGTPLRCKNEYYENGTNLWVSVRELNGGYIFDTVEKITDLGVKKSSVKLFCVGTILFSFKLSIGKTAIVGNPLYSNEAIAGIRSKNNAILDNKYLYHYLTLTDFTQKGSGMLGNGSLNKKSLALLEIPIPSLEHQHEIVKYLDFIYEKCNKTSTEKILELKRLNEFCLNTQKVFGENIVKTLGEVCDMSIKGNTNSKSITNSGEFPFYKASVSNPSGTNNTFCFDDDEYVLFIKSGGNSSNPLSLSHGIGKVYLVKGKSSGNTEVVKISTKHVNIKLAYIYYYLQSEQLNIQKLAKYTTNLGHIGMDNFKNFKIPIPSLERQKEIVDYCEFNDNLIQQLEKEIEQNKKQANLFISSALKMPSNQFEIIDVNTTFEIIDE